MIKLFYAIALLFATTTILGFAKTYKSKGIKTIVLDAGHGGHDSGAVGWNGSYEKDICLAIALKTEQAIKSLLPEVTIIQTRTTDEFIDLRVRADIANQNKGDVFVSIHCNSVDGYKMVREVADSSTRTKIIKNAEGGRDTIIEKLPVYKNVKYPKDAQGIETYVWNMEHNDIKKKAAKSSIADIENAQILNDSNATEKYGGGVDINSVEFVSKASLRVKRYFVRSQNLGRIVQEQGIAAGRNDRKVKQRGVGIWVLQATNMPSILVETGYISHPNEEAFLTSDDGQTTMANIIANALKTYKTEIESQVPLSTEPAVGNATTILLPYYKHEEVINI